MHLQLFSHAQGSLPDNNINLGYYFRQQLMTGLDLIEQSVQGYHLYIWMIV